MNSETLYRDAENECDWLILFFAQVTIAMVQHRDAREQQGCVRGGACEGLQGEHSNSTKTVTVSGGHRLLFSSEI